jgi:hypothetical protein
MSLVGIVLTPEEVCKFIGVDYTYQSLKKFSDKYNLSMYEERVYSSDFDFFIYDRVVDTVNINIKEHTGIDTNEYQFYQLGINKCETLFGFKVKNKSTPEELLNKIAKFKEATRK